MATVKKIFLWTAPRCVSTAFERSIYEVENTKVFHEPFGDSHYFGPERQNTRYMDTPIDHNASYENVIKKLSETTEYESVIFSKDMAYSMTGSFDILLDHRIKDFQHTFLIRNPKKSIFSLYKASIDSDLTGWNTFDPSECGFKEIYELYTFIKENFEVNPIVIDADDLLAYPKETMKAYCYVTGIPFNEEMLTWKPGTLSIWEKWDGWHENVAKSNGFARRSLDLVKKPIDISLYPEIVQRCINESMFYYDSLNRNKLSI